MTNVDSLLSQAATKSLGGFSGELSHILLDVNRNAVSATLGWVFYPRSPD